MSSAARIAVFTLVLAALSVAPARGATTPITVGTTAAEATFAQPTSGSDPSINNHLISLIANTPDWSGAKIRAAIHVIAVPEIKDWLLYKAGRGVDVKVVHSGHGPRNSVSQALADGLGSSRFKWCEHGGWACISTHTAGTMHSKFMLFSQTGGRSWVTWFGSANQTYDTGSATFNNGVTVYDNAGLFNAFETKIWNLMWNHFTAPGNDFYAPPQGHFSISSAATTVQASPEQQTDLVEARLKEVRSDLPCQIRVAMLQFTRTVVADQLAAMARRYCSVYVVVGKNADGTEKMSPTVKTTLKGAGVQIRKNAVHDKFIAYHGATTPFTVLTGSHNLTLAARVENDEILVQIANSQSAYNAYTSHWSVAWHTGTPV